ncbi:MAG: hypothetical protein ABIN96_03075 [Rubrivivax sp.]
MCNDIDVVVSATGQLRLNPTDIGTFINGSFNTSGDPALFASMRNNGLVENGNNSYFYNAVTLWNANRFINRGLVQVTPFLGFIDNTGVFDNAGFLQLDHAVFRPSFANRSLASLNNTGTLVNESQMLNEAGGRMSNALHAQ